MSSRGSMSPQEEGKLIVRSIEQQMPLVIDAKQAITSMKDDGSKNWKQMEWIGFYPEHWFEKTLAVELKTRSGPRYGNMSFDIQRNHVWDLKSHSNSGNGWAPLNDVEAVEQCMADHGGVGFLVISGQCTYDDDGSFRQWHETLKGGPSEYSRKIAARGARSRRRKTSFKPDLFLSFWLSGQDDIAKGRHEKWIMGFQEGMRNSNDTPRREKIMVNLAKIGDWAIIEEIRR